jgi:hypothetical protein
MVVASPASNHPVNDLAGIANQRGTRTYSHSIAAGMTEAATW